MVFCGTCERTAWLRSVEIIHRLLLVERVLRLDGLRKSVRVSGAVFEEERFWDAPHPQSLRDCHEKLCSPQRVGGAGLLFYGNWGTTNVLFKKSAKSCVHIMTTPTILLLPSGFCMTQTSLSCFLLKNFLTTTQNRISTGTKLLT
jgi:hypothetical protein